LKNSQFWNISHFRFFNEGYSICVYLKVDLLRKINLSLVVSERGQFQTTGCVGQQLARNIRKELLHTMWMDAQEEGNGVRSVAR
jgi:hypothetical protein